MTTLSFPKPPGGILTYPNNTSPIINKDQTTGEINAECYIPLSGAGLQAMKNGILSRIFGEERSSETVITAAEDSILASGEYYNPHLGLFWFKVSDTQF
ncbi:hypothetical protein [Rhizobium sp. SGZ-381]|uniref:hypothetical protein n=1 Tax=Rhizobium sp. SGZ-381 TaxID=3342800 RepID=UPI0036720ECD